MGHTAPGGLRTPSEWIFEEGIFQAKTLAEGNALISVGALLD